MPRLICVNEGATGVQVLLALGLMAIGLVLVFDALSSHELKWPLGLFALVVGVIWACRPHRLVDRVKGPD